MKRYSRATWRGEDTAFERKELKRGGRYTGDFLVFEDGPNYMGCVLFSVYGGKVAGQAMKNYWEFKDEYLVPTDF